MKQALVIFLLFSIGFFGMILYKKYTVATKVTAVQSPLAKTRGFSLDTPPSESLKGTILTMNGGIEWQSRSATESTKLISPVPVLQGEEFWTKENGSLHVLFTNAVDITMEKNTHVNFIQTLPTNFVISQDSGEVVCKKLGTIPISIRVLNLLVSQADGTVDISIDDTLPIILLTVSKGSITVAFNDSDNVSNVVTIDAGNTYRFNTEQLVGRLL